MSGNFSCIGLTVADPEELEALTERLFDDAIEDTAGARPFTHLLWTDESGAAIALHLRAENEIECITPFFVPPTGLTRWRVRTHAPADDPECEHCGGADCDILGDGDEMITRATVQWLHFQPFRKWLQKERVFDLELCCFGHQAGFYASEDDYRAGQADFGWGENVGQDGEPVVLDTRVFLPEGMFAPEDAPVTDRATVIFGGRLTAATEVTNSLTGESFVRARIDAMPGPIEVVLHPDGITGPPEPGSLALVRGWLVGRPAEQKH